MRRFFLLLLLVIGLAGHSGFCQDPFPAGSTLGLKDCEAVALQNNPEILAARERADASMAKTRSAKGDYWPEIDFESDYYRGNYTNIVGPASTLISSVFDLYDAYFSENWVLEDFGKRFAVVGTAYAQQEEAEARYRQARSMVIYAVATAYFKLLEAQSLDKVMAAALQAADQHLKLAQGFVQTGEASKIALAEAEVVHSNAEYNLLKADNDLKDAQDNLNKALGLSNPPSYQIQAETPPEPLNLNLVQAQTLAFQIRPELLAEEARVSQAEGKLNALKAEQWPVLSSQGVYGWLDPTFPPGTRAWYLGLSLKWPLFEGGKLVNRIQEASLLEKGMEKSEENMRLEVLEEVDESFRNLQSAQDRLSVANDEVQAATENESLAMARYQSGLSSPVELADAEASLSRAEAHQVEARGDLQIAQAAVRHAIGFDTL